MRFDLSSYCVDICACTLSMVDCSYPGFIRSCVKISAREGNPEPCLASDLFSLGCCLYMLACGFYPFDTKLICTKGGPQRQSGMWQQIQRSRSIRPLTVTFLLLGYRCTLNPAAVSANPTNCRTRKFFTTTTPCFQSFPMISKISFS